MLAGRLQDRSPDPLGLAARWLGACAVAALGMPWVFERLLPLGSLDSVAMRVLVGGLPVAPAAFGLGGALPLFARYRRGQGSPAAQATGGVAASVAAGGALGAWGWIPLLQGGGSAVPTAAAALAGAAGVAWFLQLSTRSQPQRLDPVEPPLESSAEPLAGTPQPESAARGLDLGLAAFVGGALLVGGQLAMLRVAAQSRGDSMATTSQVLAGLHVGMALGALWMCLPARRLSARGLVGLLLGLAALGLLTPSLASASLAGGASQVDGWWLALLLTVPLGVGAGSLVTAASRAPVRSRGRLGSWVGDLAAWSTLGGVLGGFAYGTVLAPAPEWGTGAALQLMACVALAAAALLSLRTLAVAGQRPTALILLVLVGGLGSLAWRTPALEMPWQADSSEVKLVRQLEGPYGVVSLVATQDGDLRLKLDNRFGFGGSSGAALEQRMGRLAACFQPSAERALVLGMGRGQTLAGFVSTTPARVDCVERNQQVLDLGLELPLVGDTLPVAGPPNIVHADARSWMAQKPGTYDLIVGDLFYPWVTGAGDLLSREHFHELRRSLRDGGVAVQWIPLHQLPWPAFGSVARAFMDAFPTARLFLATPLADRPVVALVGGMRDGLPDGATVTEMLSAAPSPAGPSVVEDVYDLYVADAWALGNSFLDVEPASRKRPVSELMSLGRFEDEAWIGATNMRLLSELVLPLDTSAVGGAPIDPFKNRTLGVELAARSGALKAMLLSRAAQLQTALPDVAQDTREQADLLASSALMEAWRVAPLHMDVRRALVERARLLATKHRALEGAQLMRAALDVISDPALAGVLGSLFLQLEMMDEAADLLGQVWAVQAADRVVLFDYATALLHAGRDADAAKMLRKIINRSGSRGLPQTHAIGLGLIEGDLAALPAADSLLESLPPESLWARTLGRLRARLP